MTIFFNEKNITLDETERMKIYLSNLFNIEQDDIREVKSEMLVGNIIDIQLSAELLIPKAVDNPTYKKSKL